MERVITAVALCALLSGCGEVPISFLEGDGSTVDPESLQSSPEQLALCAGPILAGIDVSDVDGGLDWPSVASAGVSFAWIKATQGEGFVSPTFADQWSGAAAAGLTRGAYHFFDPTVDGLTQANNFLGVVGSLSSTDLPPAVDIECPDTDPNCLGYQGGTGEEPGAVIASRLSAFMSAVQTATGKVPVVYTFRTYFAGNLVPTTAFAGDTLWIADHSHPCPVDPRPWTTARFWQYSWTAPVAGGSYDGDRFFGSADDLAAYAAGGGP